MTPGRPSFFLGVISAAGIIGVASLVGSSAPTGSAQTAGLDQQVAELRQMASGAHAAAQRAQVVAVIYQLDSVGFHGLEDSIVGGQIPAGALGRVRRARLITEATHWPAPAAETAAKLREQLALLEAAVRDEDPARATGPSREVHELEHTLSDQVYAWLGGSSPAAPPDHHANPQMQTEH